MARSLPALPDPKKLLGPAWADFDATITNLQLRAGMAQDAVPYVCGSMAGMAEGVAQVLHEALGAGALQAPAAAGGYRRDVHWADLTPP